MSAQHTHAAARSIHEYTIEQRQSVTKIRSASKHSWPFEWFPHIADDWDNTLNP
jgi:hypothetical protein